eukprot:424915_1
MASTAQLDGNGRLWERFELANINDRIENIYQHFKNFERRRGSGIENISGDLQLDITEQEEYLNKIRGEISLQLSELISDLELKYIQKTKPWRDENLNLKSELNHLKTEIRDLKRENDIYNKSKTEFETKYNTLKNGIDEIINQSSKTHLDRINKLQLTNKKILSEKDKLGSELKKNAREFKDKYSLLQEAYDRLDGKYNNLSFEKQELISGRDNLLSKCANLELIIRENKEYMNENLNLELETLRKEKELLENRYDLLYSENNKLNDEYRILLEKYDLEKDAFKKAIEKQQISLVLGGNNNEGGGGAQELIAQQEHNNNEELIKLRAELNLKYSNELKKRELEWTKAKNDSIKTLDSQYNQIREDKEKQIMFLTSGTNELKQQILSLKTEIKRLKFENNKIDELNNKISLLNDELNNKCKEIIDLRTELSKYKILWQHFFGLDAPLKDEIEKVNNKLDKFENYHNIQSPIPKKKRRVIIESLSQWNKPGQSPLILDTIPSPNDQYQRFELYNIHNKVIELKGFKLENSVGDIIELDSRQIKPGSCVGIALKKKRNQFDILYNINNPSTNQSINFCNFQINEIIYLCDSFDERIQIFPVNMTDGIIYDNLMSFQGEIGCPIFVKQLFNDDDNDGYKGFEFGNQTQKKIKLKNMYFKNKQNTFNILIPFKSLPKNGVIRLIITNNRNNKKIKRNDLIIEPSKIKYGQDDELLLCDSFGNEISLYKLDGTGIDAQNQYYQTQQKKGKATDCYIM